MINYSNYIELMKPRITSLVLVTSYLGFYLGIRSMDQYLFSDQQILLLIHLLLGTLLTSSGAAVLNQVIEKDYDSKMKRTKKRPLPSGRVSLQNALAFGIALSIFGTLYLFRYTNMLTGFLALSTILLYLFVYTY